MNPDVKNLRKLIKRAKQRKQGLPSLEFSS